MAYTFTTPATTTTTGTSAVSGTITITGPSFTEIRVVDPETGQLHVIPALGELTEEQIEDIRTEYLAKLKAARVVGKAVRKDGTPFSWTVTVLDHLYTGPAYPLLRRPQLDARGMEPVKPYKMLSKTPDHITGSFRFVAEWRKGVILGNGESAEKFYWIEPDDLAAIKREQPPF